jgi:hypothetical protein
LGDLSEVYVNSPYNVNNPKDAPQLLKDAGGGLA